MLYRVGTSALHRANPLTKFALLPLLISAAFVWPPTALIGIACILIGLAFAMQVGAVVSWRLLIILGPVSVALFAVNGLLIARGTPAYVGPLEFYPEGLAQAVRLFARLALLVCGGLLVTVTTRPPDLAKALDQAGMPPAFSFLLTSPLLLIDGIVDEARATREALQVRGLGTDRGWMARLRIVWFAVIAVAQGLLTDAGTRAQALDGRGFRSHPRRSTLQPVQDTQFQRNLRIALLALAGLHILALLV